MENTENYGKTKLETAEDLDAIDRRLAEERQKTDRDTDLIEDLECRKMICETMIWPQTKDQVLEGEEIAKQIRANDTWDDELNKRLCELAGLEDEYMKADADTFESVVFKAAEILGVEIL